MCGGVVLLIGHAEACVYPRVSAALSVLFPDRRKEGCRV